MPHLLHDFSTFSQGQYDPGRFHVNRKRQARTMEAGPGTCESVQPVTIGRSWKALTFQLHAGVAAD